MKIKIPITKNIEVSIYKWHSINILPLIATYTICEDDPPYNTVGNVLEVTIFGIVMNILTPLTLPKYCSAVRGPLWSKRRKKFYFAKGLAK
jgi:hypothetical protein